MKRIRLGLFGNGMADFVLREIEIGHRAASFEDSEWSTGWSAIDDVIYARWAREQQELDGQES